MDNVVRTWREHRITIPAATPTRYSGAGNTRPNYFQIINNSNTIVYVGISPNVNATTFEMIIPPMGTRIYARPDAPVELWFYATGNSNLYIGSMEKEFDPAMISQTQEISGNPATGLLGSVEVSEIIAPLPAGANLIGEVIIQSMAPLPAGANTIGNVGITSLPALPAGANALGTVEVTALPAIPAGANAIGTVEVTALPAIPAGANMIGKIESAAGGIVDLETIKNLFAYVSQNASVTGDDIVLTLSKGFRIKTAVMVTSSAAGTFTIYGSANGTKYYQIDTIVLAAPGDGYKMIDMPMPYCKVENTASADHEITIIAGGF
jgi:hypothetical protein